MKFWAKKFSQRKVSKSVYYHNIFKSRSNITAENLRKRKHTSLKAFSNVVPHNPALMQLLVAEGRSLWDLAGGRREVAKSFWIGTVR